jgi:26S proteasome regulatory subunit N1
MTWRALFISPYAEVLKIAHTIFMKVGKYPDAMRVALRMNTQETMEETFLASTDKQERRQLCYMLARHGWAVHAETCACKHGIRR